MDKIEKIRQEIERRRLHFNKEAEKYQALNYGYSHNCYGARDALRDLENFLDTLSEEPDKSLGEAAEKYSDKYCSDWAYRLEYEDAFIAGAEWQKERDTRDMIMSDGSYFRKCYELGKKDAEKEINKELIKAIEKVHEIRDVDYDIHVDTSTDGSLETISYYKNGKLVGQERSKKEE